jgi:hypothetical protein
MKQFTVLGFFTIVVISMATALPAWAERILYIDAALPGADPTNTWTDLSASGYDFANSVTNPATYNAADLSYDFDFPNRMTGTGDESLFDFDTVWETSNDGGVTPAGTNDTPFSIVAYVNENWAFDQGTLNIVSKTNQRDGVGDDHFTGWTFKGVSDGAERYETNFQSGNNVDRLIVRTTQGYGGAPILLTVTHDGSGDLAGAEWYINGASVNKGFAMGEGDFLFGTIRNDFPLVIGEDGTSTFNGGFQGSMYFIEIHDVVLTPEEVADRWNFGDVARSGQPSRVISHTVVPLASVVEISFDSISDYDYDIEETDDLPGDTWSHVTTLAGTGGTVTNLIQTGGAAEKNYRIVLTGI